MATRFVSCGDVHAAINTISRLPILGCFTTPLGAAWQPIFLCSLSLQSGYETAVFPRNRPGNNQPSSEKHPYDLSGRLSNEEAYKVPRRPYHAGAVELKAPRSERDFQLVLNLNHQRGTQQTRHRVIAYLAGRSMRLIDVVSCSTRTFPG